MNSVFDLLKERGYIEQCTHEDEIKELLSTQSVSFYIGFDPTADSLHVGHFIQIMVMKHMQDAGHRPIALLGGGTTMVGDPSGRTDMRQMLTAKEIASNAARFKTVFEKFLDFSDDRALMVNNADWLQNLNYIEFLRDIGAHFSVNRMIAAECYKNRLESGLTFLEFNYMIMQAYDFLVLNEKYGCTLQLGGNDQWSNILAGTDLIRKKNGGEAFGMTFALLVNSEGAKMGKTGKGALWLDPAKTSSYEFYQYWRNIGDADVEKCLALLTFLPMDEVRRLGALRDEHINEAKEVLAFEVTKAVHGEQEAGKARDAARAVFSGAESEDMPTSEIDLKTAEEGIDAASLLVLCGIVSSKSEARRLISQGGISVNSARTEPDSIISEEDFAEGSIIVKKGKKSYYRIILK